MHASFVSGGLLASLVFLAAACSPQPGEHVEARPTFGPLRLQLERHLDGCTSAYGTDPTEATDLGDYELVPNERAWLDCAYEGIVTIMVPNSDFPQMYRKLIAESRALTDLVERREITREQRRTRIRNLVAQIEEAEIDSLIEREPDVSEEKQRASEELVRKTFDNFRTLVVPRRVF